MTPEEIKKIPELQIEVTPAIEDAFYFLQSLEKDLPDPSDEESPEDYEQRLKTTADPALHAGARLEKLPYDERMEAVRIAYRMIDNLEKYGIPCAEWM